jgi:GPH family glycoside/pentoside/hexuronide:cation symporter
MAGTFGFVPIGSMLADAADEHELLFDRRREGLYFAGLFLAVKAAAGLGGFLGGIALEAIDFPRDVSTIASHPLPRETVAWLGLIQGPFAAAIGVLSAVALIGYRIDRKGLEHIQSELARRRADR